MQDRDALTPDQRDLRLLAFDLLACGHRVFPITQDRTPCIKRYNQPSTLTLRAAQQWPWHRCVMLGWTPPDAALAFDIDIKRGKRGFEKLAILESLLGPLDATATATTPSGGEHRVFGCPPEVAQKVSTLWMPDRTPSDIDLCRVRLRYLALYDLTILEQPHAPLPESWIDYLLHPPAPSATTTATGMALVGSDLVEALRNTTEQRNNTVYETVKELRRRGQWSEEVRAQVIEAARATGLDAGAIRRTVTSAEGKRQGGHAGSETWLKTLKGDPAIQQRKNRSDIYRVGGLLAQLQAEHGPGFGLSVRDCSLGIGVRATTAWRILGLLRDEDYLRAVGRPDAVSSQRYNLTTPRANWNSHTRALGVVGLSQLERERRCRELASRDCFIRSGGSSGFPRSVVEVLVAVEAGVTNSVADIAADTGQHPGTVRKSLKRLGQEGLGVLDYRPREVPVVTGVVDDIDAHLDRAEEAKGFLGRRDARKAAYAEDRAKHRARRTVEQQARSSRADLG